MTASIAAMNICQWPHEGEVIIVPQFAWSLMIIAANRLVGHYRIATVLLATINALGVCVYMNCLENLPSILTSVAVYTVFQFQSAQGGVVMSARAASLVLGGSFAYYVSYEMMSIYNDDVYNTSGGYKILRIGFFAAAGLAASGSFRQEIAFKEALEILVKERSQEIQAQAEKLRTVERALQASETGIAILTKEMYVVWCNGALLKMSCVTSPQVGRVAKDDASSMISFWDVLALTADDTAKIKKLFRLEEERDARTRILLANRSLEVEVNFDHVSEEYLVVLKDITEKLAREKAEKVAENEALVSKAMSESMQTLSHELRTPLQGIMGMTSLILDHEELSVPEEVRECLSMVMTCSRLLLTLINNMLDIRKCDVGRMDEFPLEPIQVKSALKAATQFCSPFATVSDVRLRYHVKDEFVSVIANDLRLQQVLINLLSNAIKYSPTGSSVSVETRATMKREADNEISLSAIAEGLKPIELCEQADDTPVVIISVVDEGLGLSTDTAHRLFGRFSKLDSTCSLQLGGKVSVGQPSGTGLGLSLCSEFISRMNGRIWASNLRHGGCRFSFYLPMNQTYESVPLLSQMLIEAKHQPETHANHTWRFSSVSVLVVDDTAVNLKVLRRMLERLGIGQVCTVDSGARALEAIDECSFDLMIVDVQMPDISGPELSDIICKRVDKPSIVGLTAEVSESVDAICFQSGMERVLHKPITQNDLSDFFLAFLESRAHGR